MLVCGMVFKNHFSVTAGKKTLILILIFTFYRSQPLPRFPTHVFKSVCIEVQPVQFT